VFEPTSPGAFDFNFYFEGVAKPDFKPKLQTFFKRIGSYIPWIQGYQLTIKSHNTFPHSSGIASSASAMAALAMCLMDLEQKLVPDLEPEFFHQKASFLARLGSGSAARSIQGPVTLWGVNKMQDRSSNLYAIPFGPDLHPVFSTYQDAILLVDKGTKAVSSSQGHQLMHQHPFASQRFLQAAANLEALVPVMKAGDLEAFIKIVELEALSLHAMMMTSNPYFILMKPQTLSIIEKIWEFRFKIRFGNSFEIKVKIECTWTRRFKHDLSLGHTRRECKTQRWVFRNLRRCFSPVFNQCNITRCLPMSSPGNGSCFF
jgi:diphosphomevalonate decarboxylase